MALTADSPRLRQAMFAPGAFMPKPRPKRNLYISTRYSGFPNWHEDCLVKGESAAKRLGKDRLPAVKDNKVLTAGQSDRSVDTSSDRTQERAVRHVAKQLDSDQYRRDGRATEPRSDQHQPEANRKPSFDRSPGCERSGQCLRLRGGAGSA